MNINEVILGGRLTFDPEVKYSPSGTCVCSIQIANNRHWKTKDGEKKEEVNFVPVAFFGRTGETVAKYFKKGAAIVVKGRVSQERWEDKAGAKKERTKIVATDFWFPESRSSGGSPAPSRPAASSAPQPDLPPTDGDDVPF